MGTRKDKQVATTEQTTLATQLAQAAGQNNDADGDVNFMKFAKGEWLFGANEIEVADDSLWAIDPQSFQQGYIHWEDEEVIDEEMAPLGQPVPQKPAGADAQVAFAMKCVEGGDKGAVVLFSTSSRGGRKAVSAVIKAISAKAAAGEAHIPLCLLESDSYKHKRYGKIYTPEFKVEEWTTPDDVGAMTAAPESDEDPEDPEDPEDVVEEEQKPAKRTRKRK